MVNASASGEKQQLSIKTADGIKMVGEKQTEAPMSIDNDILDAANCADRGRSGMCQPASLKPQSGVSKP